MPTPTSPIIITDIHAEEILDSRGNPTVSVTVSCGDKTGTFGVPSGASTGAHEALELRDGDASYKNGKGVNKAIAHVNGEIRDALLGKDAAAQHTIDEALIALDGTENKSRLGANAILGVSVACAKAAAAVEGIPLVKYLRTLSPTLVARNSTKLYMNIINGGMHAHSHLAFQEYMVVPDLPPAEALVAGDKLFTLLGDLIKAEYPGTPIGDEGGYALDVPDVRIPLTLLTRAVDMAGLTGQIHFALDVAASSFFKDGKYLVGGELLEKTALLELYKDLCVEFPIFSIEDPFDEESFEDFTLLRNELPELVVVGDDLTVTNPVRLQHAILEESINAILIKLNQIGTLTETLDTMLLARKAQIESVVSHRSGETLDPFIGDVAAAFGVFGLKSGSPSKPERRAKYEELLKALGEVGD